MGNFLNLLRIETYSKINFLKQMTLKDEFLYALTCDFYSVQFTSFVVFVNKDRNIKKIEVIDAHLNHTNHLTIQPLSNNEHALDRDVVIKNIEAGLKKENIQL